MFPGKNPSFHGTGSLPPLHPSTPSLPASGHHLPTLRPPHLAGGAQQLEKPCCAPDSHLSRAEPMVALQRGRGECVHVCVSVCVCAHMCIQVLPGHHRLQSWVWGRQGASEGKRQPELSSWSLRFVI